MGISKLLTEATSYWPAWLENSWLILSRTSFSGRTVKLTLIPVSAVKCLAVSCCRSTICGLLTIRTLIESAPPPPPPAPQPAAHPVATRVSISETAAPRQNRSLLRTIPGPPSARTSGCVLICEHSFQGCRWSRESGSLGRKCSFERRGDHCETRSTRAGAARSDLFGGQAVLHRGDVQGPDRQRPRPQPIQGGSTVGPCPEQRSGPHRDRAPGGHRRRDLVRPARRLRPPARRGRGHAGGRQRSPPPAGRQGGCKPPLRDRHADRRSRSGLVSDADCHGCAAHRPGRGLGRPAHRRAWPSRGTTTAPSISSAIPHASRGARRTTSTPR